MATLREHQKAMVDLLANGSAIPASAARLAHALHDVLGLLLGRDSEPHSSSGVEFVGGQTETLATDESINDVRLAADLDACSHSWAALTNAHTLECIHCGVKKADLSAVPPLAQTLMGNLRVQLGNTTAERDKYKAQYEYKIWHAESLEAALTESKDKYKEMRAELANVTNQRDTYKARCESLETDLEGRCAQIDLLQASLDTWKLRA